MVKIKEIILKIFAYGMIICLAAGGISLLLYISGLFIGGDKATTICTFAYKTYLPWVIKFTSGFTGIGLIGIYCSKEKALSVTNENKENDNQ